MKSTRVILMLAFALPLFGQWRTATDVQEGSRGTLVGTVTSADEARNQLQIEPDDDRYGRVLVYADAVSTTFNGFGGVINGQPEIFIGSQGFSNLRVGDRVEVRGIGRGNHALGADTITLLGRTVPADPTGVGSTRSPGNISTPTSYPSTPANSSTSYVQGVVQQVNDSESRVVITTDRREILTVRGSTATPVYYRNQTFHIGNLEVGDRIRVETEPSGATRGEIRARSIDVLQSVQDVGGTSHGVTSVTGRVLSTDRGANTVRVDTGRGDTVNVDLGTATDGTGRRVRASDIRVGQNVDISGSFGANGFVATTVRYSDDTMASGTTVTATGDRGDFTTSTVYGSVVETFATSPQLVIRDAQGRTIHIYATEDFVVRTKSGGYTTAEKLKIGDNVAVKAYRDDTGDYIAQTIRVR